MDEARLAGKHARPCLVVSSVLPPDSLKSLRPWYGLGEQGIRQEVGSVEVALARYIVKSIPGFGRWSAAGGLMLASFTVLAIVGALFGLLR